MVYACGRVESQGTKTTCSITYLPPTVEICTIEDHIGRRDNGNGSIFAEKHFNKNC